ncbi:MAG: rhodanese-like domain-containing protein [Verrucomicrobiales bacterium]|nr:rhodanese-like domain-containing protein [Verrucomicrobiales bacterium]
MKIIQCLVLATFLSNPVLSHAEDPKKSSGAAPASEVKAYKNVGVEEFDKLRRDNKNVVLDVRTAKEFESGHISGALNIDWNAPDFEKKVSELDRRKTYLVHCAVGGRSAKASDKLAKLNFKSIYNLEGGLKAWEKAGKPVEK